ncbi:MAG: hypothetical protein ACPKM0_08065 [Pleomorphochaeta sp.]
MKKLIISFIFLCLPFMLFANEYKIIRNYEIDNSTDNIEAYIEDALDSTLVAYTKVELSLKKDLILDLKEVSYNDNLLIINGDIKYKNNKMPIAIELIEENKNLAFSKLEQILYDSFRYDLNFLFNNEENSKLSYSNVVSSFYNNGIYKVGSLVNLENYNNEKSLAIVTSSYDDYSTIDFLYNPTDLINTKISMGPLNEMNLGLFYDYSTNIVGLNLDYYYLSTILSYYSGTNLGLRFFYYNNLDDYSSSIASDLSLKIEFPLSKIYHKNNFIENTSIYNKTGIGVLYSDSYELHSSLEIGIKTYISNKNNLSIAYKMDSNSESYYNVVVAYGILF